MPFDFSYVPLHKPAQTCSFIPIEPNYVHTSDLLLF